MPMGSVWLVPRLSSSGMYVCMTYRKGADTGGRLYSIRQMELLSFSVQQAVKSGITISFPEPESSLEVSLRLIKN
jgi:hypothetical protein